MGSLASECQIGLFIEEDKTARQRLRALSQRSGYLGRRESVVQPAAKDQWSAVVGFVFEAGRAKRGKG